MKNLFAVVVSAVLSLASSSGDAQPLPYQSKDKHLGVVNCANSLCHGSVSPWKDSSILQNEYVTWSRVDKHANRAYQVLFNERSQRIVKNLGYKEPAQQVKICLDCHTHNPAPSLRGPRFRLEDGVSCEACHGPAERWIQSHVAPDATHKENISRGLYPTSDPVAQARLCLSCHFGNKDKFVTHRIMGAGHPRMSFELDTFTQTQPPHFVIDEDWRKRKGDGDTMRVWAVGQALAAREIVDVLLDPQRSRDGLFPELVIFDCHACHRPMSDARWSPAMGSPGRIRLNDANFLMLRQIVRRAFPEAESRRFEEQVAHLHRAVAGDGGDPVAAARAVRERLDEVLQRLAGRRFELGDLRAMVGGLVQDGLDGLYRDYAGAEQATMAIGSLLGYLSTRGGLKDPRGTKAALDRLHESVKDHENYRPDRFRSALAELGMTAGR